jgi:hypothetical protein
MAFDLNSTVQAASAIKNAQLNLYTSVNNAARRSNWIRLASPIIAVAAAVLTVAKAVMFVVEPIVKGFADVLGSPFSSNCSFFRGLKHLTKDLAGGGVAAGGTAFFGSLETVATLFGVALAPVQYTTWVINQYQRTMQPQQQQPQQV